MQPIILLAIVGIAGGAMGVGFLGNDISLTVQQLGVGSETLSSAIDDANIDFFIDRVSGKIGSTTETHNVIAKCLVTSGQDIPAMSHVFCKLTDVNGNVVAEGKTWNDNTVLAGNILTVDISPEDFAANKVQNVHDVVLVVQSP